MAYYLGNNGAFLYRLLRNDERDLTGGIVAKRPLDDKEPAYHIRQCSHEHRACQWISTCASEEAMWNWIALKETTIMVDKCLKYVVIDRCKLETFAQGLSVPAIYTTGRILDFTNAAVIDQYLPQTMDREYEIPRNYALPYQEVLVERYIPRDCCLEPLRVSPFSHQL